jgi:hypothetical protein
VGLLSVDARNHLANRLHADKMSGFGAMGKQHTAERIAERARLIDGNIILPKYDNRVIVNNQLNAYLENVAGKDWMDNEININSTH